MKRILLPLLLSAVTAIDLSAQQFKVITIVESIIPMGIGLTRNVDDELRIIHTSGRVRIDKLDEQGIFNAEEARYTHKLKAMRRVL